MRRDRTHIRESTKTHEGRDKTHRPAYLLLTPACVFFLQRPQRFTLCGLIHRIIKCPGFLHVSSTKRGHPVILCVSITIRDGEGNEKVQECVFSNMTSVTLMLRVLQTVQLWQPSSVVSLEYETDVTGGGFRKQLACQKLSPHLNQTKCSEIACLVTIKWTHGVILMIPNIFSYLHLSNSCPFAGGFWDQGGHLELVVLARWERRRTLKLPVTGRVDLCLCSSQSQMAAKPRVGTWSWSS